MKKLSLTLALALLVFGTAFPALAQILPVEPLDRIIAVVNEDVVLQSELDGAVNSIMSQYARNPEQLPPRDVLERQVLERLIMQKLQVARANDTGLKVSDAEVDQSLAQIAQSNRMDVSQLRGAVQQQGMSYDKFRKNLHDELVVQKLRQRISQGGIQASDAEIESMMKSGKQHSGQIHLQHILIGVPDGATPGQIDEARAKAEKVREQIVGGGDFSAAAIANSDAQDALDGGDLGWRNYDQVPAAFIDMAANLQPGEVSQIVRGPSGFYLVKLVDKREQGGPTLVTEYHARHIMIKVTELTSSEQAHQKAQDLRQRITAGEDFATLAKKYSEDPTSANLGGDMGWFPVGAYGSRVAETIKDMKDGDLTEPFQSDAGWHVLQLLGTRTEDKSKDIQRDQARQALLKRKGEDEYESFLRQVRSEAFVEIRLPGYNGGTTANQP